MSGETVRFVPDPVEIAAVLESPSGMVGTHLINLATIVQLDAQARAPRKTGRLIAGIVKRFAPAPPGSIEIDVGVWTVPYAYWVHEGNGPGQGGFLYPKHKRSDGGVPMLRFAIGGTVLYRRRVRVTQPRRFLTDALAEIAGEL